MGSKKISMENKLKIGLISGFIGIIIGVMVYAGLVWTGQKPIPDFMIGWLIEQEQRKNEGLPLSMTDSLFIDDFTLQVANDMLRDMAVIDNCEKYDAYIYNDIGTAHKVYLALGYEILNGRSSKIICWHEDGGYKLGWERGHEIVMQHQTATEYVNGIWNGIEETVNSLGTEKEKAAFIAEHIKNNIVQSYDMNLSTCTIYDLAVSGSGSGVCSVFATLFDRLCEKAGIECYMMVGKCYDMPHAWNKLIFSDGSVHTYDLTCYVTTKDSGFLDMSNEYYSLYSYTPVQFNSEEGYGFGCHKLQ